MISPEDHVATVEPARRRDEAIRLLPWFTDVTGWPPRMWRRDIVGYGRYHYRYASGREGDYLVTGFSPRRRALAIYLLPGYRDLGEPLGRLGKHRMTQSCLYVNRLDAIDMQVLQELVEDCVAYMRRHYETFET